MPEEFDIQKLKEKYPEFFEQIAPELLEFILSEETSLKIANICLENGVEDEEKIEKIAYRVVLVLCEQVPKENLPEILEKGAKLDSETARKISTELNQVIFSQIKETQPIKPSPLAPEEIERPPKKDIYREPIE